MNIGTPLLSTLDARVEAAIFAAGRPVSEAELVRLLPVGADVSASLKRVEAFWAERGIRVLKGQDGWSVQAVRELVPDAMSLSSRTMSKAAVATLAVIAMHQPVTVTQIERIRGVKLGRGIIEGLKTAGLISEMGRRSGTGQAATYGVTVKFLERFDLESLSDMPTPEEVFALDIADDPASDSSVL